MTARLIGRAPDMGSPLIYNGKRIGFRSAKIAAFDTCHTKYSNMAYFMSSSEVHSISFARGLNGTAPLRNEATGINVPQCALIRGSLRMTASAISLTRTFAGREGHPLPREDAGEGSAPILGAPARSQPCADGRTTTFAHRLVVHRTKIEHISPL